MMPFKQQNKRENASIKHNYILYEHVNLLKKEHQVSLDFNFLICSNLSVHAKLRIMPINSVSERK